MIIGIVAIAKNYAIGRGGKLPWHYSADLKFFKETTTGHAVLMGSNTWRSIGRPLPNRANIVISRRHDIDLPPGVNLVHTKDEALAFASDLGNDLYVIGGAKVFCVFAEDIDKWIVTEVPAEVEAADTFMPAEFLDGFNLNSSRDLGEGLVVKTYVRSSQN